MKTMILIIISCVHTILLWPQNMSINLNPCPKCGDTQVPYPFSTTETCGDPRYKAHCTSSGALELPSATGFSYKILSIDSIARRLIIMPPGLQPGTCYSSDFHVGGLRLDETLPFNVSARNTVMLLNCSTALLRSPLNCSSNSLCRLLEAEDGACGGALCCHYLKDSSMTSRFIRVRDGGCTAYTSVVGLDDKQSVDKWNYGVELQWLPPNY